MALTVKTMNDQLPIKQIFTEGMKMPFANYKELIRLGWPYAFLILASSFMPDEIDGVALNIAYAAIFCITGVLGIVGCHRVFLLPKNLVNETSTVRWSYRETKFMLCMLGIGILTGIISIPFFFAIFNIADLEFFTDESNELLWGFIFTISFMPAYYFVSRWSLILPDSAVDNDRTLSWAWNVSSGYSFRLFVLIGALPLTTNFIFGFIVTFLDPSYILSLVQNAIWLIVAVIEICLLSLSYEWIVSKQEPENDC